MSENRSNDLKIQALLESLTDKELKVAELRVQVTLLDEALHAAQNQLSETSSQNVMPEYEIVNAEEV